MEPGDISAWVTAATGALELLRSAWQLLPRGDKKDELEAEVKKAEDALQRSSAALMKNGQTFVVYAATNPHDMLCRHLWDGRISI
jgi:hypothetical protein